MAEKTNRAKAALGGKSKSKKSSKKGKKAVHKMHIRHAANGGYIVEHEMKPEPGGVEMPEPNEEHAIPDMEALKDHVGEHMEQAGGEEEVQESPEEKEKEGEQPA